MEELAALAMQHSHSLSEHLDFACAKQLVITTGADCMEISSNRQLACCALIDVLREDFHKVCLSLFPKDNRILTRVDGLLHILSIQASIE